MAFGLNSLFIFAYFTLSTVEQLLQGFGGHISVTDSTGLATRPRTAEVTYTFNWTSKASPRTAGALTYRFNWTSQPKDGRGPYRFN